jgi:hypothetical protein
MNALVVVNTNNFMLPKCRETIHAAVTRWGCDFVEIHGGEHVDSPSVLKIEAASRVTGYHTVAVMDADVFVSKTCPPPFELAVESSCFYVAPDVQEPCGQSERWRREVYNEPLARCVERTGRSWKWTEQDFFNSGLFVFRNTRLFSQMFGVAVSCMPKPCSLLDEQAMFNLVLRSLGVPIQLIDTKWNHVVHPDGLHPDAYINHFAGEAKRFIEGAEWI